jgi:hypothetical protein
MSYLSVNRELAGFVRFAEAVERERARYRLPSYRRGLLCSFATERPVVNAVGSAEPGLPLMVQRIVQNRSSSRVSTPELEEA